MGRLLVNPSASENDLLYLGWVEQNRARVTRETDGKVGYLHIPDMGAPGIYEFTKWFYGQLRKQGLIIDVRGNGGGNVSQMVINRLARDLVFMGYSRGVDNVGTYPNVVFTGPLVARKPTPSSLETICASVVLPSPGGPKNST